MGGPSTEASLRLDRSSPVPLWSQLHDDLRRRLDAGELVASFPAEMELVASYGVSRNTVREAMRRLRADGTVVAGRGRRPRLNAEIRQPLGSPYSLFESVEAAGLAERSVVRALEVRRDETAARHLERAPETLLVYLERLRLADEEPLAIDRIWLPHELAAPLLGVDFCSSGFYEELSRRTGVRLTGGSEHLRVVVPTKAEREELQVPTGVGAFAIDRLGRVGDRPVEWRRSLVRGDRFSVVAEFSSASGRLPSGRDLLAASSPFVPARPGRDPGETPRHSSAALRSAP